LIQQRHELTSDIRISDEPPTCHQYIRRKSQFPTIRDTGLATLLITGVEKSQIASTVPESDLSLWGKSFRIAELVGREGSRSFSRTALAGLNDVR
jgi:hypothetical protein